MQRRIVPDVIDGRQDLCCLGREATARHAAEQMRERRIGAVLVVDGARLVGIVTERDLVFRVVAAGRDPAATTLGEIMTAEPQTLAPDDTAAAALARMRDGRYRHLPVLRGGQIVGMVSIRDLHEAVRLALEEELHSAETLIFGDRYGSGAAATGG
ncbi:MAG: CBS domain-containing protein [Geminicoccaceae bacterium]